MTEQKSSPSKYQQRRAFVLNEPNAPRLNPALAMEIGLNESILFLQLEYLIAISDHEIEGYRWTYQSVRDLQEKYFTFWSIATINRAIKSLIDRKLLVIGNFNKHKYDRTRWFAINFEEAAKLKSIKIEGYDTQSNQNDTWSAQDETRPGQDDTTIPETTPETTPETIPSSAPSAVRKPNGLLPDTQLSRMMFGRLQASARTQDRRGPVQFKTLEQKQKFDEAAARLGEQEFEKALTVGLEQGINSVDRMTNWIAKWDGNQKGAPHGSHRRDNRSIAPGAVPRRVASEEEARAILGDRYRGK